MNDNRDTSEDVLSKALIMPHAEHGIRLALVGIGYAVLDLASAVREGRSDDAASSQPD